jgi:hypothetical protein
MQTASLDEVVREYIISEGRDSMHKYPQYLQFAIRGLKELQYDVYGVPKVEVLTVDTLSSVTLPQDVIRVIRMGFVDGTGRFVEIYSDNTLVVDAEGNYNCSTGNNETPTVNASGQPLYFTYDDLQNVFRNGQVVGRQYGNAGGGVYSYRVDETRGTIQFSSNVSGQIVLEYLADPNKVNGQFLIHPFLIEPVMAFIYYASMRYNRAFSPGEKQYAFTQYVNKKHHANLRFTSESVGSLINASRKTFNGSAKY